MIKYLNDLKGHEKIIKNYINSLESENNINKINELILKRFHFIKKVSNKYYYPNQLYYFIKDYLKSIEYRVTEEEIIKCLNDFKRINNYHYSYWEIEETLPVIYNLLLEHMSEIISIEPSSIIKYNSRKERKIYNILFKATSESILKLCEDPKWLGAKVGITSILHTWGQTMEFHPHIHSIVTGGGIKNNKWTQTDKNYLIKVQVLSSLFRGKFLSMLKGLDLKLPNHLKYLKDYKKFNDFLRPLYKKDWVEYIEPPKGSPENVIEYIGRYSFRIAISNKRIKDISNGKVTFEYKDYKDNSNIKVITITAEEFIRRFLMHVLPDKFVKIKHYGLLANRSKKATIRICRILMNSKIFNDFTLVKKIKRKLQEFTCNKCGNNTFHYSYYYLRS